MPSVTAPNSPVPAGSPAKKKSKRTLYVIIGVVVVIALVVAAAMSQKKTEKPTPVSVEKARIRSLTHLVTATGKVQPQTEVKI